MLITSLIVGILFLKNIWLVLVMVMIATLLELFVKNYPDDLIIPLCAGFGAQLTAAIFGLRPLAKGYSIGFIVWGILVIGLAAIFSLSALYKKIRG
jgi:hypothetical protein